MGEDESQLSPPYAVHTCAHTYTHAHQVNEWGGEDKNMLSPEGSTNILMKE